jgi:protein gp37
VGRDSGIEWTQDTWNPWRGCEKVSPGCKVCYAERFAKQNPKLFPGGFSTLTRAAKPTFDAPLRVKAPRLVFTCSLSDFFHEAADAWRPEAWDVIRRTPHHTYQILTKRPENIAARLPESWGGGWANVWLGVSAETQGFANLRIPILLRIPAKVHWVSAEPLLGPIAFEDALFGEIDDAGGVRPGIDWVVTGGESDLAHPRPMSLDWVRAIRDECRAAGTKFFHKQNGGQGKCHCHRAWGCRLLDGQVHDEMPEVPR